MCLVFVEYRIRPECRDVYLLWLARMKERFPAVEWYESMEQPGLYVELWRGLNAGDAARLKRLRAGSPLAENDGDGPEGLAAASKGGDCAERVPAVDETAGREPGDEAGEALLTAETALWHALDEWIPGGRAKIHAWTFSKVRSSMI